MGNQVAGLDGYNYFRREGDVDTKLNNALVPEATPFAIPDALDPDVDYSGIYVVEPVDKTGNPGARLPITTGGTGVVGDVRTLTSTPEQAPMSTADRAAIDAIVARCIAAGAGPGVSIAVVSPKGHYEKTYGSGTGDNSHFRIASQTKGFTRHAVLRAIDAGRVSPITGEPLTLDSKLEDFYPGVPNGNIITVEQMMMMRSGIFDYAFSMQGGPLGLGLLNLSTNFTLNVTMAMSVEQIISYIKTGAPLFTPGTAYYYTNGNYYLLAKIVEAVDPAHRSIDQIITQDILTPLAMVNTSMPAQASGSVGPPAPAAIHYDYNPILSILGIIQLRDVTVQNPAFLWAAGSIFSVLSDLIKWGIAEHLGVLLSPEIHNTLLTRFEQVPQNPPMGLDHRGPPSFGYGLGFIQVGSWFGLDGSWVGSDSCTMYLPVNGTVISVYENFQTSSPNVLAALSTVWYEIADYLYPYSPREPGYLTGEDSTGTVATTLPGMSTDIAGRLYLVGEFQPFEEINQNKTNAPVPDGAEFVRIKKMRGSGGHGGPGTSAYNSTGGSGGGSGAVIQEILIPVTSLGANYSVVQGVNGADSQFTSGTVKLVAGGGKPGSVTTGYNATIPGGAGGLWTAQGATGVTGANGVAGGSSHMQGGQPGLSGAANDVGGSGAGGRGSYGGISGGVQHGGSSATVPGTTGPGGDAANADDAGAGGGEGQPGGLSGAGGGGGYSYGNVAGQAGALGSPGVVHIGWE